MEISSQKGTVLVHHVVLRLAAGLIFVMVCRSLAAQSWAAKMFRETEHDFGVVARGATVVHRFELQNIYKEDVHIAAVRSSCGCTTPEVTVRDLKTWEKSEIVAVLNTHSFLGARSATITVVFDKPYYAEVQLHVSAYIRSDVVCQPGIVRFSDVQKGESAEVAVDIAYAGRPDWQIVDVCSACRFLEVELREVLRQGGQVRYRMVVRLKPDTPVGHFNDELLIVTDDRIRQTIPLAVEGYVRTPLTASPSPLVLFAATTGQTTAKRLLVRSQTPCRIRSVAADQDGFIFEFNSDTPKTAHFVTVRWTGETSQRVETMLHIITDKEGFQVDVPVTVEPSNLSHGTP